MGRHKKTALPIQGNRQEVIGNGKRPIAHSLIPHSVNRKVFLKESDRQAILW
ncbi:MAG: hypothetical protein KME31_35105 [Tolypothrix carrinoi HA7290-LM1]|nr:hypothetical protein [Tolypothrix carrinoi HA7290-LM1]